MAIEVKVPSVGESVTSGILGSWKQSSGSYVRKGDLLFEIETDKVTSEVYAEEDGELEHLVQEGDEVDIGQVVACLNPDAQALSGNEAQPSETESHPASSISAGEKTEDSNGKPASRSSASDEQSEPARSTDDSPPLSPAVRKLVEEKGVDVSRIEGSGKGGRILKADVLNAPSDSESAPATPPGKPEEVNESGPQTTRKRMSALRRKIAERLVSSQHEAAILTTFNEVDMTNVIQLRQRFQDRFVAQHGVKLGFMSLFVKAAVHALQQVPALNARIDGNEIVQYHYFDLGIAISTEKGLMVPVLRNADQLTLAGIELGIIEYAQKAREGKISLNDLEGGVFSITNGGIFGSMLSTPIINPPQAGILGMHTIKERPMAVDGRVEIRPMMYLALSYDHRLVDGKEAVTFLVRIKEFIEQPALALLEL